MVGPSEDSNTKCSINNDWPFNAQLDNGIHLPPCRTGQFNDSMLLALKFCSRNYHQQGKSIHSNIVIKSIRDTVAPPVKIMFPQCPEIFR